MNKYDLAIIGSGPCGYVAGIRAAQLGMKVCVFEEEQIGGVCLNRGCIPTKALQASSSALYNVERANEFGINVKNYEIDFSKVYERKNSIVKKLSSGIEMLLKNRKIEVKREKSTIEAAIKIAKNVLISTGSLPFEIPGMEFDGVHILNSSNMLELREIPKSLVIVGGGVIGCEFASIFKQFGTDVTIVEMMECLLPLEDEEIAKKIEISFKKRGIKIFTKTKAEKIERNNGGIIVHLSNGQTVLSEKALISIGRIPNTKGLGIENAGIECNKGWIKVDNSFRTNFKNVYAAGDVIGGVLLAHLASKEGASAVSAMCGKEEKIDNNVVPSCIFTRPEIGSVGLSEKKAKDKGLNVKSRKFFFASIGKSHVLGETDGFIKLVVDSATDKILGAQIIGHGATELIAEVSPCIQFGITSEKLASVIHAHPTLSEVIQEASEAINGRAVHSL